MKIAISTESSADLSQELINEFNIRTIPLTITLGEDSYLDGEFPTDKIFEYVKKNKVLPKTSAVNEFQFTEYFENLLKDYDAVIHLSMTSKVSSTCDNAIRASKNFKNVYVVDTLSLCAGMALLAIYAQTLNRNGESAEAIVEKVKAKSDLISLNFVVDKLDYLKHGGRCSALQLLGANLLKIRPTIVVKGGASVGKKYVGPLNATYKKLLSDTTSNKDIDKEIAIIPYTTIDDENLKTAKEFCKNLGFKHIYELKTNSTIATHCGELAMGLAFFENAK